MATTAITFPVDSEVAKAIADSTPEERRKIEVLIGLRLRELTLDPRKSLKQIMDEVGAEAERRGLTPAILAELLNGE